MAVIAAINSTDQTVLVLQETVYWSPAPEKKKKGAKREPKKEREPKPKKQKMCAVFFVQSLADIEFYEAFSVIHELRPGESCRLELEPETDLIHARIEGPFQKRYSVYYHPDLSETSAVYFCFKN